MNTSPTQMGPTSAVEAATRASSGTEPASDLFSLLMGGLMLMPGDVGAQTGSGTGQGEPQDPEADALPGLGEFAVLFSQLPGMSGESLDSPQDSPSGLVPERLGAAWGAPLPLSRESALLQPAAIPAAGVEVEVIAAANRSPAAASAVALAVAPGVADLSSGKQGPSAVESATLALQERTRFDGPDNLLNSSNGSSPPRATLELALPPGAAPRVASAMAEGMAARMNWMAQSGTGRAEIRLHPAELGSIDVQLHIEGKNVRAEFVSANAEVRQMIEQSLPRLRELFEAQGLNLQHTDVGSQGSAGKGGGQDGRTPDPGLSGSGQPADAETPEGPRQRRPSPASGLSEYA